jgi:hypothetical protein
MVPHVCVTGFHTVRLLLSRALAMQEEHEKAVFRSGFRKRVAAQARHMIEVDMKSKSQRQRSSDCNYQAYVIEESTAVKSA